MKAKAVLFGLNYSKDPSAKLNGCENDVYNISSHLKSKYAFDCKVYTDKDSESTLLGMISTLYELANASYSEDLDFVWIHYSGHGTHVKDTNNDERDGEDEALVPTDFRTAGILTDDYICKIFKCFNPKTQVFAVFDCCHSATIGDLKYVWGSPTKCQVENILCDIPARVITLSGCLDEQTSADAYNVLRDSKYSGALSAHLLLAMRSDANILDNAFKMVDTITEKIKQGGFTQMPRLASSFNLAKSPSILKP